MLNQFYGEAMVNIKVVSKLGAVGFVFGGIIGSWYLSVV